MEYKTMQMNGYGPDRWTMGEWSSEGWRVVHVFEYRVLGAEPEMCYTVLLSRETPGAYLTPVDAHSTVANVLTFEPQPPWDCAEATSKLDPNA